MSDGMRLLQVALAAPELAPVVEDLRSALGLEVGFRDPAVEIFGLENAVLPMRDTYLEVVAPVKPDTAAGRFLERRGGPGGYMVILQVDDLAPPRARAAACGVRVAWEGRAGPEGPEGASWEGIHLHPADTGAAMISLDRPDPPDSWLAAGPHWRDHVRDAITTGLRSVVLQGPDPDALAARWSAVLGRPRAEDGRIALDRDGALWFREGAREEIASVYLAATDHDRAGPVGRIGGVDFALV